ncbi:transposase-like zinc-binding domain-containing protein [Kocuria palustris]|uniref:transposase-like zinc-binding domain-containing protein n=1 Tax=Kocuria palustris TaxID=71999 RepID=UPI00406353D1
MALPANRALCQVCAHPLVRNGTTSAGRTRWRCKHCGASTTRTRTEITAAAQMNAFHNWLLGRSTQSAHGGTGRSFRAATAWCWNITVPPIEPTGLIADQVMIDGTYFNGWCVLIAFNTTHVIDWQWCDREKHTAWAQLLARVPAPRLVIVDGGTGIHAALRETWAQTPVQRCYFHILQTVRRHTTYQPRTTPGREILALTRALMRVRTLEQASDWLSEYSQWEHRWDELLKQRSYPRVGIFQGV